MFVKTRALLRMIVFTFLISMYLLTGFVVYILNFDPDIRRRKLTLNSQFYARLILKSFNVTIFCKENIPANENSLLVGNHVGFIDIVCLHALQNCVFITSLEMKHTPILGQITDIGGCAYVDRKNRMNIQAELKGITDVLKKGFRVVLYAESVASNGEQVLPFKKTLLMSAGFAEKPIRPFVFNFRSVNRKPVLYSQRDFLCWYGKESFLSAIYRSMQLDEITCEIEFLPLVVTSKETDRSVIAKEVHDMVSARYIPFKPEMNLQIT